MDHTHTPSDMMWAFLETRTGPLLLERYVVWQLAQKNSHTK